jgi:hypothetical protein
MPPLQNDIHAWVYVIIPITNITQTWVEGRYRIEPEIGLQWALFSAFCKNCRSYFSERIPVDYEGKAQISKSGLPKDGCKPDGEVAEGFSSLPVA